MATSNGKIRTHDSLVDTVETFNEQEEAKEQENKAGKVKGEHSNMHGGCSRCAMRGVNRHHHAITCRVIESPVSLCIIRGPRYSKFEQGCAPKQNNLIASNRCFDYFTLKQVKMNHDIRPTLKVIHDYFGEIGLQYSHRSTQQPLLPAFVASTKQ
jgi:hypothetical protein